MANSCFDSCYEWVEEDPLTRLEVEELINAIINPTASKGKVKRKRSKSLSAIVAAD